MDCRKYYPLPYLPVHIAAMEKKNIIPSPNFDPEEKKIKLEFPDAKTILGDNIKTVTHSPKRFRWELAQELGKAFYKAATATTKAVGEYLAFSTMSFTPTGQRREKYARDSKSGKNYFGEMERGG